MNEKEEIQINFNDFLHFCLKRWRRIFFLSLLCGLIIAGLIAVKYTLSWDKNLDKHNSEVEKYEEDCKSYDEFLIAFNIALDDYKKDYERQEEYINNSVLANLDYENVLSVEIELMPVKSEIISENFDNDLVEPDLNNVLKAYYNYLYYYADWKEIGKLIKRDPEYAKELVDVKIDYNGGMIYLRVLYPDKGYANSIANLLIEKAQYNISTSDYFAGYELIEVNHTISLGYSEEIKNIVRDKRTKYNNSKADYEAAKENVEDYTNNKKPVYPQISKNLSRKHIVKVMTVMGVVGFVLGVFLMLFIYYSKFARKGIIYSANEFNRITGVGNLGVFPRLNRRKRIFGIIDRIIAKREKDSDVTEAFAYDRISIHLQNKVDFNNIVVIGDSRSRVIVDNISKKLEHKKFLRFNDFSSNEALSALYDCDGVIFVVEREKTMLPDILTNMKIVKESDKRIVGNIVV